MPVTEKSASQLQSDHPTSEASPGSGQGREAAVATVEPQDVWALAFTAALVAFVGAIVVLSIPYAVFSVSLPASVNRLGLSVEATQGLLFERVWTLLIPSALFAGWIGYKFYRWGRQAMEMRP